MTIEETVEIVAKADNWNARIAAIPLIPEQFGTASHQEIYSAIARRIYVPSLAPDFAYIHWHDDYELPLAQQAYDRAHALTSGFTNVSYDAIVTTLQTEPTTLRVFRLLLGFTAQEFAAATALVVAENEKPLTTGRIRSIESGSATRTSRALERCAAVIDLTMTKTDAIRAILECKGANDGGTARDKAARFHSLRQEAARLGGVPLFAVLAGLGWTRTADALGPVIQHTDGRTFTIPTLGEMLSAEPFPSLI